MGKLQIPKTQKVSYGYFLIVTQSDVNDSSTLFFSNVLHKQLIFITLGDSVLFPSVHISLNGSRSKYITDGHILRKHNPPRQGLGSTQHMEDLQNSDLRQCCTTPEVISCVANCQLCRLRVYLSQFMFTRQ